MRAWLRHAPVRILTFALSVSILAALGLRIFPQRIEHNASRTPVTITYAITYYGEAGEKLGIRNLVRAYRSDGSRSHYMVSDSPHFEIRDFRKQVAAIVDPLIRAMVYVKRPGVTACIPATCEAALGARQLPGTCA